MELRHGEVVGLQNNGRQVTGVQLRSGEIIATQTVVLAMGPWSQQASAWIGLKIPIYPVRGQLLELLVPEPQLQVSLSYDGNYLLHKADGITQAGTTYERDSGFVNHQTPTGLEAIMNAALGMAPSLEEARVMNHVSGLRPASGDSLPLIGPIPKWKGVYIVAGHDRKGMGLSLISTRQPHQHPHHCRSDHWKEQPSGHRKLRPRSLWADRVGALTLALLPGLVASVLGQLRT
jgi:glycine oxidase